MPSGGFMKSILFVVAIFLIIDLSAAGKPSGTKGGSLKEPYDITVAWAKKIRQGSNLKIWIGNQGINGETAWDNQNVPPDECSSSAGIGCAYPATSCIEHLFGAGAFIAALVDGSRCVTEGYNGNSGRGEFLPNLSDTSRDRMWLTSIDSLAAPNKKGFDDDGDGSVDEDELDGTDNDGDWNPNTDDVGADGLTDSQETGCNGGYDPISNPDPAFDNYEPTVLDRCHPDIYGRYLNKNNKNIYTQNNGLSDHGEPHVDEDYGAYSQSDYYCSYTDTFTYPVYPDHKKMGIKVWQKSYAWEYGSSADAILIMEYSFVNLGNQFLTDVYLGMFADMDVGPITSSAYFTRNYSAYDRETHTGYSHNPVDRGSTPLGLTLLGTSTPLDSLKQIFQWHDFNLPCGGTVDSLLYDCYSGGAFPDALIKEDQPPTNLLDSRFVLSNGPFNPMQPGDTTTIAYAFVSGMTVQEMLLNAKRAHRIYEANGFIMPNLQVKDSGMGKPVRLSWNRIARSPFGNVVSYKILFGVTSGVYNDSLVTTNLFVDFNDSMKNRAQYFVALAVDEYGNRSALSDEINLIPQRPAQPEITDGQISISLRWNRNPELDLTGYNIYRRILPDTNFIKLNSSPLPETTYSDTAVWGDKRYAYRIAAIDETGFESAASLEVEGALIPPATPRGFVAGSTKTCIRLGWFRNIEGDMAGYKLYRTAEGDTEKYLLTQLPPACTLYTDASVEIGKNYVYDLTAIDTTDAESAGENYTQQAMASSYPNKILVVNAMFPPNDTVTNFYQSVFRGYPNTVVRYYMLYSPWHLPLTYDLMRNYSTVVWLQEDVVNNALLINYPLMLKGALLGERNLIVMGRKHLTQYRQFWADFLNDYFGIDLMTEIDTNRTFIGADGWNGFPDVSMDTLRFASVGGRQNYVERFPYIPDERVIYRYRSDPFDLSSEGKPIGVRATDSSVHAYYMSFPLYSLDTVSARALVVKLMQELGEPPLAVKEVDPSLPERFELLQNYPNPFNPATNIRFTIPGVSAVRLTIYDMLGRNVKTLIDEQMQPGSYTIPWDAGNSAAGIYYCRFTATDDRTKQVHTQTTKLVFMK